MPAVRTYVVTQEREVKVTAASPSDAIQEAAISFAQNNEDNRDNRNPLTVETSVSARQEF